jgi:hypothetical protein
MEPWLRHANVRRPHDAAFNPSAGRHGPVRTDEQRVRLDAARHTVDHVLREIGGPRRVASRRNRARSSSSATAHAVL